MRVNIAHSEKQQGLLRKTTYYVVTLDVQFSEEEKQIIKEAGIEDELIIERTVSADKNAAKYDGIEDIWNLTIKDLLQSKPDVYAFFTPADAKLYEEQIREQMPKLKQYIEINTKDGMDDTSFEL